MPPSPSNLKGALLSLASFGVFATADGAIKALGAGYNPLQIMFFSGLLSFPVLMIYGLVTDEGGSLRPRRPGWMAVRSGVILVNSVLGIYAFSTLPLAQCYAIFFAMPLFITLLAVPMLGERIDPQRGVAVLAGLVGVLVALDPDGAALQVGHLAALGAAALGAVNSILIRKTGAEERTFVMIVYPTVVQFGVVALVLPLVYVPMPMADLGLTGYIAVAGFAGTVCLIAAYRRAPAIVVAPMQYSQILWAAIMGALLFGEQMSGRTLLGIAVIIAAGVFIIARQDRNA